MPEEIEKSFVEKYEESLKKLGVNTEKIAPEDRTGNGRYAAAYEQLYSDVRKDVGKYAFCYIFGTLYVPKTEEGIEMLQDGMEIIRKNGKALLQAIFSFDIDAVHKLLNGLYSYIVDKLWIPLETKLINSDTMPPALFVESMIAA